MAKGFLKISKPCRTQNTCPGRHSSMTLESFKFIRGGYVRIEYKTPGLAVLLFL